jgi:hypothetical protein
MSRRAIACALFVLAAAPLHAQQPADTWQRCPREVRIDSVSSSHVAYTVLRAPCSSSTVGRSYKLQISSFQSEYLLLVADTPAVPPPPPAPAKQLVYYGGDNQTGAPGATLTQSISVRVTDSAGVGIDGDTILWRVVSGGGALNKTAGVTVSEAGRTGWNGARWTLGSSGVQTATATHQQTGQAITFTATLAGAPPPPPPPPPADTTTPLPPDSTVQVFASCDFNGTTLCAYRTVPTPPNTACNHDGIAGKCSAAIWLKNGHVEIEYQTPSGSNPDDNHSIEWVPRDTSEYVGWGEWLYMAGTWKFPRITPEVRAIIDSIAAARGIPSMTDEEYLRALQKIIYGNRQMDALTHGANHFVMNVHDKILRLGIPRATINGVCDPNRNQAYSLYSFIGDELIDDRGHRLEFWLRRASGPLKSDGELITKLNGVQVSHVKGICTDENALLHWRVSFGQQFQFSGAYFQMRELDDVVIGKREF